MSNENNRIFDYFIVTGLPPILTAKSDSDQLAEKDEHRKNLLKNAEMDLSSGSNEKKDPIVDIAIMNRTLNEGIPSEYECIWNTPLNYSANLCCEFSMHKSNEMYLLIRRGLDKPPIADIGIYYEGNETVREGCTIIKETIGKNSANLNTSSFNTERVFITYRRLDDFACNCLAMIDVCVIYKGKVFD